MYSFNQSTINITLRETFPDFNRTGKLSKSYLLTDFNDLDICCQGHHSEQHFPLNFLAVGFGLRDIHKKLYLQKILELPTVSHIHRFVTNLAPTDINTVGCETDFNILCRKYFINISETKADHQKVSREMLFGVMTLTTYVKVDEERR